MTPVEQGRFCSACQTTLLDFTNLTDHQALALTKANPEGCGRFYEDQLNRPLVPNKAHWHIAAGLAIGLTSLFSSGVQAQQTQTTGKTPEPIAEKPSATTQRIINGTVLSTASKPIEGVTVTVKGTNLKAFTDAEGKFSIAVSNGQVLYFTGTGLVGCNVPVTASLKADTTFEIHRRAIRCGRYF